MEQRIIVTLSTGLIQEKYDLSSTLTARLLKEDADIQSFIESYFAAAIRDLFEAGFEAWKDLYETDKDASEGIYQLYTGVRADWSLEDYNPDEEY